jgi:hypothetical protein
MARTYDWGAHFISYLWPVRVRIGQDTYVLVLLVSSRIVKGIYN